MATLLKELSRPGRNYVNYLVSTAVATTTLSQGGIDALMIALTKAPFVTPSPHVSDEQLFYFTRKSTGSALWSLIQKVLGLRTLTPRKMRQALSNLLDIIAKGTIAYYFLCFHILRHPWLKHHHYHHHHRMRHHKPPSPFSPHSLPPSRTHTTPDNSPHPHNIVNHQPPHPTGTCSLTIPHFISQQLNVLSTWRLGTNGLPRHVNRLLLVCVRLTKQTPPSGTSRPKRQRTLNSRLLCGLSRRRWRRSGRRRVAGSRP